MSWHYPHKLPLEEQLLISRYFRKSGFIENEKITSFPAFIQEAANCKFICIRPEVREKPEAAFEQEMLGKLSGTYQPDLNVIKAELFGPLRESSCQHCLFDPERHNQINGNYNLKNLNKKLDEVLIRREKRKVLDQLPNLQQTDYHAAYTKGLAQILRKNSLHLMTSSA
ncbi:MAG: hypothetical protein L3J31_00095 [Bacteroidales bacterium]|nr:hypothetical protein [Bacteroidales bacterium]